LAISNDINDQTHIIWNEYEIRSFS